MVTFQVSLEAYASDTCVYIDWVDEVKFKYGDNMPTCNEPDYSSAIEKGSLLDVLNAPVSHVFSTTGLFMSVYKFLALDLIINN